MKESTLKLIDEHLQKARKKHPVFSHTLWQTVSIATEELGEFAQAINDYFAAGPSLDPNNKYFAKVISEALDLIAVMVRFLEGD